MNVMELLFLSMWTLVFLIVVFQEITIFDVIKHGEVVSCVPETFECRRDVPCIVWKMGIHITNTSQVCTLYSRDTRTPGLKLWVAQNTETNKCHLDVDGTHNRWAIAVFIVLCAIFNVVFVVYNCLLLIQ